MSQTMYFTHIKSIPLPFWFSTLLSPSFMYKCLSIYAHYREYSERERERERDLTNHEILNFFYFHVHILTHFFYFMQYTSLPHFFYLLPTPPTCQDLKLTLQTFVHKKQGEEGGAEFTNRCIATRHSSTCHLHTSIFLLSPRTIASDRENSYTTLKWSVDDADTQKPNDAFNHIVKNKKDFSSQSFFHSTNISYLTRLYFITGKTIMNVMLKQSKPRIEICDMYHQDLCVNLYNDDQDYSRSFRPKRNQKHKTSIIQPMLSWILTHQSNWTP